jgi:hypothetical protein
LESLLRFKDEVQRFLRCLEQLAEKLGAAKKVFEKQEKM